MEDRLRKLLGGKAEDVYNQQAGDGREQVLERGRENAELTSPSILPPDNYKAGDELPGNNQAAGALLVNNLASKIMFTAFPPGRPIMKLTPVESKLREQIDRDPRLYTKIKDALRMLAQEHKDLIETTPLATAYVGYIKLLLVAGNALWKHIHQPTPTFHRPDSYVVIRDNSGHPLVTVHKETTRLASLSPDVVEMVHSEREAKRKARGKDVGDTAKSKWQDEVDVYSVCVLDPDSGDDLRDRSWVYWQEVEGRYVEGTEIETDYEDCPMWPGWLIPVYGSNWGTSYCEEYKGDLFVLENAASSLNDGASVAAWMLTFVKPGGRTSVKDVERAPNLKVLPGSAEDVSHMRTDKAADFNFVANHFQQAWMRLSRAFLMEDSIRRDAERVTAEEIARMAQALNRAMGGLYTELAQGHQRPILTRAIRLNEEANKDLPRVPRDVVRVSVVTGMDVMGSTDEQEALLSVGEAGMKLFPKDALVDGVEWLTRYASARGVRPEGLIKDRETVEAGQQQAMQQQAQMALLDKAAGPVAGAVAQQALAAGQQPPPDEAAAQETAQ